MTVSGCISDRDTLVYHEGAHAYLFHIEYPPGCFESPAFDYVSDYYAYRLQLEKRYRGDQQRIRELLLSNGFRLRLELLCNGAGQAILMGLREHWKVAETLPGYLGNYSVVHGCVGVAAPLLPSGGAMFSSAARSRIKQILEDSFARVWGQGIVFPATRRRASSAMQP